MSTTRPRTISVYSVQATKRIPNGNSGGSSVVLDQQDYHTMLHNILRLPIFYSPAPTTRSPQSLIKLNPSHNRWVLLRIIRLEHNKAYGQIAFAKNEDLLQLTSEGVVSPLPLDSGSYLYEPAHFVWYYSDGIILLEYTLQAPRARSFREYIMHDIIQSSFPFDIDTFALRILINKDAYNKLLAAGPVATFEIAIYKHFIGELHEDNVNRDIVNAFHHASRIDPESEIIGIELRRRLHAKRGGMTSIKQVIRSLMSSNGIARLKAKVEPDGSGTGRVFEVNLLEDKISEKIYVRYDTQLRIINSKDIFDKMDDLYLRNRQFYLGVVQ